VLVARLDRRAVERKDALAVKGWGGVIALRMCMSWHVTLARVVRQTGLCWGLQGRLGQQETVLYL
jgi:hypothetical protein